MIDSLLNNINEIKVIDGGEILGSRTMILSSDLFKMLKGTSDEGKDMTEAYQKVQRAFKSVGGSE